MIAEIISIGNELLQGKTLNTNAQFICTRLAETGISTRWISVVGDNDDDIRAALSAALSRTNVCILTGGLGPTHDDITKEAVCKYFNSDLLIDNEILETNKERFRNKKIPFSKVNRDQALVPSNAKVLPNALGTAPGRLFDQNDKLTLVLPGVPKEMENMMNISVLPILQERSPGNYVKQRVLHTAAIPESVLFNKIGDISAIEQHVKLAFLPSPIGVNLRLTVQGTNETQCNQALKTAEQLIRNKVQDYIYGVDTQTLEGVVAKLLREIDRTIAVAESCTGGLLAHTLTNVSGSSRYFERGVVSYSNESKMELLGVQKGTLEKYGAVSAQTAQEMAAGVRRIAKTDIGMSTTGIAGPSGGTPEKPVGLVFIGFDDGTQQLVKRYVFPFGRLHNKIRSATAALDLLRRILLNIDIGETE